jgi:hypothetical protein
VTGVSKLVDSRTEFLRKHDDHDETDETQTEKDKQIGEVQEENEEPTKEEKGKTQSFIIRLVYS